MRVTTALPLAALVVAGILSGCGVNQSFLSSRGGWNSAEVAAVSGAVAEDPEIVEDALLESEEVIDAESSFSGAASGGVSVAGAVRPLRYWRKIATVDRRFEFAFSDSDSTGRPTVALVTIYKQIGGTFNILGGTADSARANEPGDGSEWNVVRKPLADEWVRRVLLRRIPREPESAGSNGREWRIVAASGVRVESVESADERRPRILSVRLQTAAWDTTITDPLRFFTRYGVRRFAPESDVLVTVSTERPDDVVMLMNGDGRFHLRPNGDRTYSGVWRASMRQGIRHFGVNALSRGTLFDDEQPYHSTAWLWHYVVLGSDVAGS